MSCAAPHECSTPRGQGTVGLEARRARVHMAIWAELPPQRYNPHRMDLIAKAVNVPGSRVRTCMSRTLLGPLCRRYWCTSPTDLAEACGMPPATLSGQNLGFDVMNAEGSYVLLRGVRCLRSA